MEFAMPMMARNERLTSRSCRGHRTAQAQNLPDEGGVRADVAPFQRKGQLAAANQNQGKGHADGLRRHGGIGRSGYAHVKAAHQQQITGNVADTGDQHRNEGHNRITDAPENTAENVVGHDEYRTGRADAV